MIRHLCNLQSVLPDISSTNLAPYKVITILLTVFPTLYFTAPWLFCNCTFVLLNFYTFLNQSSNPLPLWQPPVCSLCLSLFLFCCSLSLILGSTQKRSRALCFINQGATQRRPQGKQKKRRLRHPPWNSAPAAGCHALALGTMSLILIETSWRQWNNESRPATQRMLVIFWDGLSGLP